MIDATGLHTGGHDAIAAPAPAPAKTKKMTKKDLHLVDFSRDQADLHPKYWSDGIERHEVPIEGATALADTTPHLDIHILGARVYCARPLHY
mmetsp:Transcript_802/g.1881  ORF Transcript_802/g.1881 Transcript_802/m.1881 type:complete len:92 (+) Transcript_802:157-432(+)